jgi:alcohol dehydrogenase YqhD (iron-dependent ADH family)
MIFLDSTGIADSVKKSCRLAALLKSLLLRGLTFLDFSGIEPNSWTVKLPPDERHGRSTLN